MAARGAPKKARGAHWSRNGPKRRAEREDDEENGVEMTGLHGGDQPAGLAPASLDGPIDSSTIANMDQPAAKELLAMQLWSGGIDAELARLREANPLLVQLLYRLIANEATPANPQHFASRKQNLVDGILVSIVRAQSQKKMPLLTAAIGVVGLCNNVSREFHDAITFFYKGASPSEVWLDSLMESAIKCRPPPSEDVVPFVIAAAFDNLTMKTNYGSYMVAGESGERIDMTNWMTCQVPRFLAPPAFDARRIIRTAQPARPPTPSPSRPATILSAPSTVPSPQRMAFFAATSRSRDSRGFFTVTSRARRFA